ncbi:DUF4383 domain-containing protein [Actinophytocola xanthii]|uniref:DUF4383 domain-containing protein n=1 Tax=Actinophytocola xanthii TaxID=1912961 RepID=A0A1Q8CJW9_9PSEU|nr:DUF4383 domain-containing protein [Actinophytocola xanthii]OLF14641.1 hypothetical protein BU204_26225 [Actinophytocola xanthii]
MSNSESTTDRRRVVPPARLVMLVLGIMYLVLAVIGFITVGFQEFGPERPERMLGVLGVSTLLSIVHTGLGAVLTVAALRGAATALAPVATVAFTALSAFGIVARVFGGTGDPLNLTWWNIALYLVSAVACGLVGALPRLASR